MRVLLNILLSRFIEKLFSRIPYCQYFFFLDHEIKTISSHKKTRDEFNNTGEKLNDTGTHDISNKIYINLSKVKIWKLSS